MTFHDRHWEKRVRAAVRARLKRSRALWKEYKSRRETLPLKAMAGWFFTLFVPFWLVHLALLRLKTADAFLLMLSLYATGTVFFRAQSLHSLLYVSHERTWALHVPLSDSDFFSHAMRVFLRHSLLFLFVAGVFFARCPDESTSGWLRWGMITGAAALQWSVVATLVLVVLRFWKNLTVKPGMVIHALMVLLLVFPGTSVAVHPAAALLPAGLVNRVFLLGLDSAGAFAFVVALLISSLLLLGVLWRSLRANYPENEIVYLDWARVGDENGEEPTSHDQEESMIPEMLGAREWFQGEKKRRVILEGNVQEPQWQHGGWIERVACRWMGPRELNLLEFAAGTDEGSWTRSWKLAWIFALVGGFLVLIRSILPIWLQWLPFVPCLLAVAVACPLFAGSWAAFEQRPMGLLAAPVYAFYPAGFFETSRVIFKLNLVRLVGAAPIVMLCGALLAAALGEGVATGARAGLGVLLVAATAQPFFVAGKFSSGTDDTKRMRPQMIGVVFLGFASLILFVVGTAFLFLEVSVAYKMLALALMSLCSFGFWATYGRWFERGPMDTVTKPSHYPL